MSFVYTKKEPRPAFRYRLRKSTLSPGLRFVTVVVPYATGPAPRVSARLLGTPAVGAARVELEVVVNGETKRVGYALAD